MLFLINEFLKSTEKIRYRQSVLCILNGNSFCSIFHEEQNTFRYPTVFLFHNVFQRLSVHQISENKHFFKILILNAVAGIICAFLIIHNHNEIRLMKWFIIVVLGLLYNSFFLDVYIRKILLKVFYVGLVWALVNCWLTFLNSVFLSF
jgi:hypothetical protein